MAQYRDHLIEQGEETVIPWEEIARRALGAMSEAECRWLAWSEWNIDLDEDETS